MSQADAPAADWYPDPSGRFQFRYWDGEAWTGHVSTEGKTDWDPPGDAEAEQDADGAAHEPAADEPAAAETVDGMATADAGAQWAPLAEATAAESDDGDHADHADEAAHGDHAAAAAAAEQPQGGTIEEGEPSDTNLVANQRAGLDDDVEAWLNEVASQVEPRLSRIEESWTTQPQAEAARACAYGLLVGHLAHLHPHMRSDLSLVAESHPSFTTLEAGSRLDTLEQIARDPQRTAAWLGPLIGTEDVDRVTMLFD
ncbi:hypothetical protein BH23ACT9_BH23ACT9_03170 [soil metagenome]